jgi:hypothetical protein
MTTDLSECPQCGEPLAFYGSLQEYVAQAERGVLTGKCPVHGQVKHPREAQLQFAAEHKLDAAVLDSSAATERTRANPSQEAR